MGVGQLDKIDHTLENKAEGRRWLTDVGPVILGQASKSLGSVSWILCFGIVLLVSVDVLVRALRVPMSGILEISRLTLGWICFSSLVYTFTRRQHVSVTVFVERMPEKWRTISEILACLLGALLMFAVFWKSVPFFLQSWDVREVFNVDVPLPYWLAKLSIPVGTFVFGMVYLADLVRAIIRIFRKGGK
jgi:C4-dicarboxylate transporter DctQ subunit